MAKQYLLLISKSVAKDLQDLQPKQYKQVVAKILSLGTEPIQQDCKALSLLDALDEIKSGKIVPQSIEDLQRELGVSGKEEEK